MDHLLKTAPKRHSLFLPEMLVEDIPNAEGSKSSKLFKEFETAINKEEEAAIEAIRALGVGCPAQVDEDKLGPANYHLSEHVRDVEGASLLSPKQAGMCIPSSSKLVLRVNFIC